MAHTTDIIMIIDESGSMSSMGNEPLEAVNSFIEEQKKNMVGHPTFTLWKFNNKVVNIIREMPLQNVTKFSNYSPKDMTALADAIGHAIDTKLKSDNKKNVVCVIVTDGQENCSREYTMKKVKEMTTTCEKNYDWRFIYLGANQDAFSEGSKAGFNPKSCAAFQCTTGGLKKATENASECITQFCRASSDAYSSGGKTPQLDISEKKTPSEKKITPRWSYLSDLNPYQPPYFG